MKRIPSRIVPVPRLEGTVKRSGVLRATRIGGSKLTVLVAPAGYGKSVAAAQILAEQPEDVPIWVDCAGIGSPNPSGLLAGIQNALDAACSANGNDPVVAERQDPPPEGAETALIQEPSRLHGASGAIVLDDLPGGLSTVWLRSLVELINQYASEGRMVIITTRHECSALHAQLPSSCIIGVEMLRMTRREVSSLMGQPPAGKLHEDTVDTVFGLSGGQAALAAMLMRHAVSGSLPALMRGCPSLDLQLLLESLAVSQLGAPERELLYALSLFGHGTMLDLRRVLPSAGAEDLRRIALCFPLVAVLGDGPSMSFSVHDLAASIFRSDEWAGENLEDDDALLDGALARLDEVNRHARLFRTLLSRDSGDAKLCRWAMDKGDRLLDSGHTRLLSQVIDALGSVIAVREPILLILHARLLREQHAYQSALRKIRVALELAVHNRDAALERESLLMMARLHLDQGMMVDAASMLERALGLSDTGDGESEALARAYLSACYSYTGRHEEAIEEMESARECLPKSASADVAARIATCWAATAGLVGGRWVEVVPLLRGVLAKPDLSLSVKMQAKGNMGTVLGEVGHLHRAEETLGQTVQECANHGLRMLELAFIGSLASVKAGMGKYEEAARLMDRAIEGHEAAGDDLELGYSLTAYSSWLRAEGKPKRALMMAQRALELGAVAECEWLKSLGVLEVAAGLLALGDEVAAVRHAQPVRDQARRADARTHRLCADLILAEAARRAGLARDAVAHLADDVEYIQSESPTWLLSMYVRAFPGLLGILVDAVGAAELPAAFLQMTPSNSVCEECGACPHSNRSARNELLGTTDEETPPGVQRRERLQNRDDCVVQLFGGLRVKVGGRLLDESAWRKGKARLLFAMLVLHSGRDLPRDQVLEYLWPDMDVSRAMNNFYVVWSAMKRALSPGLSRREPCEYVENRRSICRVHPERVSSDVVRFEQLVSARSEAELQDSTHDQIRICEELASVYCGDLLPGDVYEDWFASARDRYRIGFADAMLGGARAHASMGNHDRAVWMLRRGIEADPWREDLYQALLREQIVCGQRSAAVETYMSCKKHLVDGLGLDPCSDTLRLYEQVLAMEEAGSV